MHHYTDRSYHEIEDTLHDYITVHVRPNKYICVFTVTCQKNLGSVGRDNFFFFFLLSTKPEIVVPVFNYRKFR